jgi:hypothetical protein
MKRKPKEPTAKANIRWLFVEAAEGLDQVLIKSPIHVYWGDLRANWTVLKYSCGEKTFAGLI